jgi:DNA-binding phage protein
MMSDPEVQKMMSEHQQKMQEEQSRFREAMQKKMMSDPQNIQMMLQNMLQNQEAFKKTLNDNPELKEQLKKAL